MKLADLMPHLPEHLPEGCRIERRAIGGDTAEGQSRVPPRPCANAPERPGYHRGWDRDPRRHRGAACSGDYRQRKECRRDHHTIHRRPHSPKNLPTPSQGSRGFLHIPSHVMLPSNNFRLGHGCSLLNTHELIAKGMRFTLEVAKDAITILLFIGVLTRVDILCAIAQ